MSAITGCALPPEIPQIKTSSVGATPGETRVANMFANIFGASPVQPIEKHCDIAYQCVKQLNDFFAAVVDEDWDSAAVARDKVRELEQAADDLKKEIRLHLPKSLFMPVPREDLLQLLLVQDRMANRARDVASLVMVRKMTIPKPIAADLLEFVKRNVDAAKQARKSVRELDELFTTGFRGAEVELVESLIEELDRIESDTDERGFQLYSQVFAIESSLDPVSVIFLYRVLDLTGEIADMAERVGRRLELLLSN